MKYNAKRTCFRRYNSCALSIELHKKNLKTQIPVTLTTDTENVFDIFSIHPTLKNNSSD